MEGIKFCLSTGVDKIANFENDLLKFGIKSHRAPIWNKGMDLLLKAFFAVRSSNSNIKPTDKGSTVPLRSTRGGNDSSNGIFRPSINKHKGKSCEINLVSRINTQFDELSRAP